MKVFGTFLKLSSPKDAMTAPDDPTITMKIEGRLIRIAGLTPFRRKVMTTAPTPIRMPIIEPRPRRGPATRRLARLGFGYSTRVVAGGRVAAAAAAEAGVGDADAALVGAEPVRHLDGRLADQELLAVGHRDHAVGRVLDGLDPVGVDAAGCCRRAA